MFNALPKILVAGNAGIDLYFRSQILTDRVVNERLDLALGGKYLAEEFYQFFGGGGANAAVSFAIQGFTTQLWSHVGNDDFGKEVVANLNQKKVNSDLVFTKADKTAVSCVLLTMKGDRTIINFRSNADNLQMEQKVSEAFSKNNWFVIYSLAHCQKDKKLGFIQEAKNKGLKVFLSLHSSEYAKGLDYLDEYFALADVVHLNAHELADIYGKKAKEIDFAKTNFGQTLKIPILLVSYDRSGSYAYADKQIYYQPMVPEKRRLDTTGAGDSFSSGFLGQYLKSGNIAQALLFGATNATGEVENLGAQTGLLSGI